MRLTKSAGESGHEPQADGESAAPAAAAAPVLVLSDIEEDEPVSQSTDSKALPCAFVALVAVAGARQQQQLLDGTNELPLSFAKAKDRLLLLVPVPFLCPQRLLEYPGLLHRL